MQIGSSLFLLAAGAILAFAVQDAVNGVDLTMVGYILIAVGALGLIVSLILSGRSRDRRGEVPPPR
ncbi:MULTISPECIES: DUF6458 family protein [unclassified Aeromicrobium]|uniref:DUF6458 family protein n=1 Tax=unclassified Aeromicrobium TaxID=2633570 RepID=UPI0006FE0E9E|nr:MULTISPECIES: DUF6458 family protein [unclassified Aeromicrobium]KQO38947.1 hypothetical protein ASF05_03475 [Aeromicrobium sp. Leaf245]KQP25694.1 hypothetical protein ASF38_14725 [Aeromicrobium sp. Leaf272]RYY46055.1 MAG: hypothetical protein EON53_09655 [Actinomycetales bacterium]